MSGSPKVIVLALLASGMLAVPPVAMGAVAASATFRPGPVTHSSSTDSVSGSAGLVRSGVGSPAAGRGTAFTSRNWDGYISYLSSQATDFNVVRATWTQPAVKCEKPNAWTVFWVGLDGWLDNTVEQGGSSAQCSNGTPQYTTWWEMYPTNSIQTVFTISPGDHLSASVTYMTATATFVIKVSDLTSGHSFTKNEKCANNLTCNRSSTDVIAEDVGEFGGGSFFPLADYGTVSFGGSKITDTAKHTGSFTDTSWLHAAVKEAAGGVTYATVSALSGGGAAFKATWKHA
jgi:Peptidase A4 family